MRKHALVDESKYYISDELEMALLSIGVDIIFGDKHVGLVNTRYTPPDDLTSQIALHEKRAEEAGLQALLMEYQGSPQLVKRLDLLWGQPQTLLAASSTWGDPVRKVQFIDTYERWIPSKPKEARDITISRTLLCEGSFDEVDVELLEQEVSANYHPFQYGGEYLSAWGYEPSTDEVTLRFLKGQS